MGISLSYHSSHAALSLCRQLRIQLLANTLQCYLPLPYSETYNAIILTSTWSNIRTLISVI
jgi:hypothetical protein